MNLTEITPLVLTYNEEPNIARCLEHLSWAARVVVVDSGSTDRTLAICAKFPNVEVIQREFDDHTSQWNSGVREVATDWVLAFDADYIAPESLSEELVATEPAERTAFYASFHYVIANKRLRGTLYPDRAVLFSRHHCKFQQDGHTQLLNINGETGKLATILDHDDRKPLSRWLDSQRKYASLEAEKLSHESEFHGMADRLRKMIWPAAPAAFLYTIIAKCLVFDGWPGVYYAMQRTYAELLLSLEMMARRLDSSKDN